MEALEVAIVVPSAKPKKGKSLMSPGGAFSLFAMAEAIGTVGGRPILVSLHHEDVHGRYEVSVKRPDILLLSVMTSAAERAEEIATEAMKNIGRGGRQIAVVQGGYHPTFMSEESSKQSHLVVRGEVIPEFLKTILEQAWAMPRNKRLITRLATVSDKCIERTPIDFRRLDTGRYWMIGLQGGTGCPFDCSFCVAPKMCGVRARFVPLYILEAEVKTMPKGKLIALIDDNALQSPAKTARDRLLAVAELIHRYGHKWVAELTMKTLIEAEKQSPGFIRKLSRLGCIGLYFGVESVEGDAGLSKSVDVRQMLRLFRTCHAGGMMVIISTVIGLKDSDTLKQARRIVAFAEGQFVDHLQVAIKFPPPGSLDWMKALKEKLLTSLRWRKFDGTNSVLIHPNLSPESLEGMARYAYRRFYSLWSIAWRLFHPANFVHPLSWLRRIRISLVFNLIMYCHFKNWRVEAREPDEPISPERLDQLADSAPFKINEPDGISIALQ